MLLGTLGASLLGNMLVGKGAIAASQGWGINTVGNGSKNLRSKGDGMIRTGYGSKKNCFASSFN